MYLARRLAVAGLDLAASLVAALLGVGLAIIALGTGMALLAMVWGGGLVPALMVFIIGLAVGGVGGLGLAAIGRLRRRAAAIDPHACTACGYDLRGSPAGEPCPECGKSREGEPGE